MKPRNVVWCARSRHRLAWLEADPCGALVVVAQVVAPGRDHGSRTPVRMSETQVRGDDPLDPFETLVIETTCPCGDRFSLDLVAVIDGRRQTPRRITDAFPGLSWRRARLS